MWPDDQDLAVEVEAAFGANIAVDSSTWTWTDLSSRLRAVPIRIRSGRSSGATNLSPGTATVTLDNDDGHLTPLHPMSPYWPNVELGTPLRVRIRRASDTFTRTVSGSWGTAATGQAWTTSGSGGVEFSVAGGVGRHSHPTTNQLRRSTLAAPLGDSEQMVDVSTSALLTGAAMVTGLLARYSATGLDYYWLRCEFNAGGTSVALKISRCVAGTITDIATLASVPGLAYAANTPLRVRANVQGSRLAIKAWPAAGTEPAGWQLTATDTTLTRPGLVGVQSWVVGGNTNPPPMVTSFDNYAARVERFAGFADQWEPTLITTTTPGQASSAVRVTCSGILRRFTQGDKQTRSPLARTIAALNPVAYWPIEDGVLATQAGAVVGDGALAMRGSVSFDPVDDYVFAGAVSLRYGTSALADLSKGGILIASVPTAGTLATSSAWTVHVVGRANTLEIASTVVLMEWTTSGTYVRWRLQVTTTSRTQVVAYTPDGTATMVIDYDQAYGILETFAVGASQVGGNISVGLWMSDNDAQTTASVAGTLGGVAAITLNATAATSSGEMPMGHLAVFATATRPYLYSGQFEAPGAFVDPARTSYEGERADIRLARLVAEDGLTLDMPATAMVDAQRMGWQAPNTPLELYQECVDVDGGLLMERSYGLAYLPRTARYNRPADIVVDLRAYNVTGNPEVLAATYDDQGIRNRWTVDRVEGSSATADDPVHQRRGVYSDTDELNVEYDRQLPDQAAWRVRLGTVVDLREASMPLDLAANPGFVDAWLSCGVGSRIVRTNPPAQYRPGDIDRIVEGWTEVIGPRSWMVQVVPSPATPWDVAVIDGADQRAAADGSTLAANLTAVGLSLSLASTASNGPWTTAGADFPLDVRVGGERITLSGITGSGSPQAATISARGVNGVQRAWPAGTEVDVWSPAILAL